MSLEFARLGAGFQKDCALQAARAVRLRASEPSRIVSALADALRSGFAERGEIEAALKDEWSTTSIASLALRIGSRVRRVMNPLPAMAVRRLVPQSSQLLLPGFRRCARDVITAGYGCGYVSGAEMRQLVATKEAGDGMAPFASLFQRCIDRRGLYWKHRIADCVARAIGKSFKLGAMFVRIESVYNPDGSDHDRAPEQFALFFSDSLGYVFNARLGEFPMAQLLRMHRSICDFAEDGWYIAPPLDTAISPFGYGGQFEDDLLGYLGEVDLDPPGGTVLLPRGMIEQFEAEYGMEIAGDEEAYTRIVRALRFLRERGAARGPASDAEMHPSIKGFVDAMTAMRKLRKSVMDGVEVSSDENGGPAALVLAGDLSGLETLMVDDVYNDMVNTGSDWWTFYAAKNAARALDLALVDAWVITSLMSLFEGLHP